MSLNSFLITSLSLAILTPALAILPGMGRSSNSAKSSLNENLSKTKNSSHKKTIRIFRAELYGALCKECLKTLQKDIKSEKGVKSAIISPVVRRDKNDSYAPIKVIYQNPTVSKEDLVEIIKFNDLYPLEIVDKPL